jgi:hypothetical protein
LDFFKAIQFNVIFCRIIDFNPKKGIIVPKMASLNAFI